MEVYVRFTPPLSCWSGSPALKWLHVSTHQSGSPREDETVEQNHSINSTLPVCVVEVVDVEEGRGATLECHGAFIHAISPSEAKHELDKGPNKQETIPITEYGSYSQRHVYITSCQRKPVNSFQGPAPKIKSGDNVPLVYICYGSTGTGKTFTLFGPSLSVLSDGLGSESKRHYIDVNDGVATASRLLQHYDLFQAVRQRETVEKARRTFTQNFNQGSNTSVEERFLACIAIDKGWQLCHAEEWLRDMCDESSGIAPRLLLDLFRVDSDNPCPSSSSSKPDHSYSPGTHARRCVWFSCVEHGAEGVTDLVSLALQEETKRASASPVLASSTFRSSHKSHKSHSRMSEEEKEKEVRAKIGNRLLLLMEEAFLRFGAWGAPRGSIVGRRSGGQVEGLHTMAMLHRLQERLRSGEQQDQMMDTASTPFFEKVYEEEREELLLRCLAHYKPEQYKTTMATGQLWNRVKGLLFTSAETCWCVLQYILLVYRQCRPTTANPTGSSRSHVLVRLVTVEVAEEKGICKVLSDVFQEGSRREVLLVDLAGSEHAHGAGEKEGFRQPSPASSARARSCGSGGEARGGRSNMGVPTNLHSGVPQNPNRDSIDNNKVCAQEQQGETGSGIDDIQEEEEDESEDNEENGETTTPHRRARTAYKDRQNTRRWLSHHFVSENLSEGNMNTLLCVKEEEGYHSVKELDRSPFASHERQTLHTPPGAVVSRGRRSTSASSGSPSPSGGPQLGAEPIPTSFVKSKLVAPLSPRPPAAVSAAVVQRETQHINTSLLALRRLVQQWAQTCLPRRASSQIRQSTVRHREKTTSESRDSPHMSGCQPVFLPFKENPLTAMMEPFLRPENASSFQVNNSREGMKTPHLMARKSSSRIVLMLCCSMATTHFAETLVSLRLGAHAMGIKQAADRGLSPKPVREINHRVMSPQTEQQEGQGDRENRSASRLPHSARVALLPRENTSPNTSPEYRHPMACGQKEYPVVHCSALGGQSAIPVAEPPPNVSEHPVCTNSIPRSSPHSLDKPTAPPHGLNRRKDKEGNENDSLAYYESMVQVLYDQCVTVTQRYQESVEEVAQITALMVRKEEENQRLRMEVSQLRKRLEEYEKYSDL